MRSFSHPAFHVVSFMHLKFQQKKSFSLKGSAFPEEEFFPFMAFRMGYLK